MVGSYSGSAVTVAWMRRPKYSISTESPTETAAGQVGVGDRLGHGVAVSGARDVANCLVLVEHRFLAQHDAAAVVDRQAAQAAGGAFLGPAFQCCLAHEVFLGHLHGEAEAGLVAGRARWSCPCPTSGSPFRGAAS